MALGTVMVISRMPIFPATMASAASRASSAEGARTIGTRPTSRIFPSAFSFDQDMVLPSLVMKIGFHILFHDDDLLSQSVIRPASRAAAQSSPALRTTEYYRISVRNCRPFSVHSVEVFDPERDLLRGESRDGGSITRVLDFALNCGIH